MGSKETQLDDLGSVVTAGIRATLAYYGVKQSVIDNYAPENGQANIFAASDMKDIGKISSVIRDLNKAYFTSYPEELLPLNVIRVMNNISVGYSQNQNDSYYPHERMMEKLSERYGDRVIEQSAFELEASLDLEKYTAKRTITVPAKYSFKQLHSVLQVVFGWYDYHLHEFEVPQDDEILHVLCSGTEDYLVETPNVQETDAVLSDILKEK